MMQQIRAFIPLFALVCAMLFIAMHAKPAYACSCGEDRTLEKARDSADAIFVGRVVGSNDLMQRIFGGDRRFTFAVSDVWKGPSDGRLVVRTGTGMGDCGYGFEREREYLIYAREDDGLETNICTRTVATDRAAEDLAFLGADKSPISAPSASSLPVALMIIGGLVLVAGVTAALRARRAA